LFRKHLLTSPLSPVILTPTWSFKQLF